MKIICDQGLSPGWFATKIKPSELSGVFIVKGTFRLQYGKSAIPAAEPDPVSGDLHSDDDPAKGLRYASDFAPFKPYTDLLLHGSCYTPERSPLEVCRVAFQVGRWMKQIAVIGDRIRERGVLGYSMPAPSPFTKMSLGWENAYGGTSFRHNPVGKGRDKMQLADGTKILGMPNLDYPSKIMQSSTGQGTPVSFSPVLESWPQRRSKALKSDFGSEWVKSGWPFLPKGFDFSYFNAAPLDQQLKTDLKGNEDLFFENLHPEIPHYLTKLPGIRARCFVGEKGGRENTLREVPLRLDTLFVEPNAEKLILLWRGHVPVPSLRMHELEHLYLASEPLGQPRKSLEEHQALYQSRVPEDIEIEPVEPPPPSPPTEEEAELDKEMEGIHEHLDEREAEVLRNIQAKNAELTAAGQPPFPPPPVPDGPPPNPSLVADQILARHVAMQSQLNQSFPGTDTTMPRPDVSHLKSPDNLEWEEEPTEITWTREKVQEGVQGGVTFSKYDLSGLDLSEMDLSGAKFLETRMRGVNLSNSLLKGAELQGADLREGNLQKTDFTGARLEDANLTSTQSAKARFTGTKLQDADFTKAELTEADFTEAAGSGCCFHQAQLRKARFDRAQLKAVDFTEALLEEAAFRSASLYGGRFENAKAAGIIMEGADLTRLHASDFPDFSRGNFQGVQAPESCWEEAILDGATFSDAHLTRATFMNASLKGATFFRSEMERTRFDEATLPDANIRESNVCHSNFERANLLGADLRGSNFYNAEFWDAVTTDAVWTDANVKGTKLA